MMAAVAPAKVELPIESAEMGNVNVVIMKLTRKDSVESQEVGTDRTDDHSEREQQELDNDMSVKSVNRRAVKRKRKAY